MGWNWPSDLAIYKEIDRKLDTLLGIVQQILTLEKKMAVDFTAITAEVARQTTVDASIIQLLDNVAAALAAIAPSSDPATQASLDALRATLQANDDAIAAAVVKNTPAPPAATPAST